MKTKNPLHWAALIMSALSFLAVLLLAVIIALCDFFPPITRAWFGFVAAICLFSLVHIYKFIKKLYHGSK